MGWQRAPGTEHVGGWSTEVTAIAAGLGAVLMSGALLFGCEQALDLASLREGDSDAAVIADARTDATDAREAAADATPDAGPCPLTKIQTCNPIVQCGCAVDENCEITSTSGTSSCSSIGKTPLWGDCGGYGVCQKGAECVDHACKPFCKTTDDCVLPGRVCEQVAVSGVAVPGLTVCSAGCDLRDPSVVCEPGVTCNPVPWDGAGLDRADCIGGVGTGMGPGACAGGDSTKCAPGYSCLGTTCARWCRLGHNEDCTSPAMCAPLAPQPRVDMVPYGLCQ